MVGTTGLGVGVVSDFMVDSGVTRTGLLFLSYLSGSGAAQASRSIRTSGVIINLYKTYLWVRNSIPCWYYDGIGRYLANYYAVYIGLKQHPLITLAVP